MTATSLGDLAQSFTLRNRNVALKTDIGRLTTELATGRVAEPRQVLAGNYSQLTDMERKLDLLAGYDVATTEAGYFAGALQTALGRIEDVGQTLALGLVAAGTSVMGASGATMATEARAALDALTGTINGEAAGRGPFGGTATDRPALVPAATLLTQLRAALAGSTTAADMMSAAKAWFDNPAGYDAVAYLGADTPLSPFSLSSTDSVTLDVRATDPKLKAVLRLSALAALADDPGFALDSDAQSELFAMAGQEMLAAQDDVIDLRARVGSAEARIDMIAARNAAEATSIGYARSALLEVDPFETATRLEEAQFQLQSLYAVTVRMSQLSLVNFL